MGKWLGKSGRTIATIGVAIGASAIVIASGGTLAPLVVATLAGAAGGLAGNLLNTAFAGGSFGDFIHSGISGVASGALSGLVGEVVGKWAVKGLREFGFSGLSALGASPVMTLGMESRQ